MKHIISSLLFLFTSGIILSKNTVSFEVKYQGLKSRLLLLGLSPNKVENGKIMKYYIEKTTNYSFEEAVERVTEELKNEGFGIVTEIDMQKTLQEKINVDFRKYKILEACNPAFAYKSLQAEENIGIMLPCNIVVQENNLNKVGVAGVNPVSSMRGVNNPKMDDIAMQIQHKLKKVINNI